MLPKLKNYSSQKGSTLVIGIFVITVMFLLASSLIRIQGDAEENVSIEVWGIRALAAANSGAEFGLSKIFPISGTVANCLSVPASWTPPSQIGFSGCSVTLTCTEYTLTGYTTKQIAIRSNAICETGQCSGGALGTNSQCLRVNRQVEVQARLE